MGTRYDVAIAVHKDVDKIMRETLNSLSQGHESIQLLDAMFTDEKEGWKLYHSDSIKWYDCDPVIANITNILRSLSDEAENDDTDFTDKLRLILICEDLPDGAVESIGGYDDPFCLSYNLRIEFERDDPETRLTERVRTLERFLREVEEDCRCTCHEAYTGRGLHEPNNVCYLSTQAAELLKERA